MPYEETGHKKVTLETQLFYLLAEFNSRWRKKNKGGETKDLVWQHPTLFSQDKALSMVSKLLQTEIEPVWHTKHEPCSRTGCTFREVCGVRSYFLIISYTSNHNLSIIQTGFLSWSDNQVVVSHGVRWEWEGNYSVVV